MSSSQDPQGVSGIPSNLPVLIGPQLIGLWFNWALMGSLFVQVYIYYLCFPGDSKYIKTLVYGLFLAEIAETCLATNDAFHWLVYWWGRHDMLGNEVLAWFDVPIMTGVISCTVQITFAWRIWILSRSRILAGVIVTLSLLQGSAAVANGIQSGILANFDLVTLKLVPSFSVWMVGSALVDILIAVSMIYLLTQSKNGFRDTDYLIARLVRLAVETGSVTAVVATVDVILFNVYKNKNFFIVCPTTVLAKLYTNSLMMVFNNRLFLRASKPLATFEGSVRPIEPDSVDFYRTRIRDAMSPNGPRKAGVITFADTFKESPREAEVARDVPLDHISSQIHDVGLEDHDERPVKVQDEW